MSGAKPPMSHMPLRGARRQIYPLQHQLSPHETSAVLHYYFTLSFTHDSLINAVNHYLPTLSSII